MLQDCDGIKHPVFCASRKLIQIHCRTEKFFWRKGGVSAHLGGEQVPPMPLWAALHTRKWLFWHWESQFWHAQYAFESCHSYNCSALLL